MAKDGKGKKGKGGKAKAPKEIAGVKVPKKLRKLGNKAVKAAKNPVVSEVVAGALLAAAAALREGKDPKTAVGAAVKGGVKNVGQGAKQEVGRLSDSLKMLAMDLARRTLETIGEKKAERAQEAQDDAAPAPAADVGEVRTEAAAEAAPQPRAARQPKATAQA